MEIELDLDLNRQTVGFLIAGLFIGVLGVLGFNSITSSGDAASQNLVGFLENQTGQNLEVEGVENAGNFYQVDVRTPDNQMTTYYVSEDGNRYTGAMSNIDDLRRASRQIRNFSRCLRNSGTIMFGNISQRATQAQIQALGGRQVVAPIYQDVNNNQTLRKAAQLGIQQVPAFYRNQSAIQGPQTLAQVEEFTGCTLQGN